MKKIKLIMSWGALVALLFASCAKDEVDSPVEESQNISQEVLDKIGSLSLNTNDVVMKDIPLPDGTLVSRYVVEGDITIDPDKLDGMSIYGGITTEQYRTNNLVSSPRTLTVIGYTGGGGYALTNSMRTGLQWAVANYNRLNLGITMSLSFAASTNADMVVYRNPTESGAGGSAGFPSGGNPNKFIQIFTGLDNASNNVNEHVATHEIGHSIGFRHTDWFSRQSCGQNVNEGTAGVGAVHIPGTPTGYDSTSIMLSCFSFSTNGEFNNNDITALNFLY
ncbi:M57 family metalloprotease [Galbibacter mesophilus]|uniref:M57 family metalloprotease n=1 Tax=Galbibacter mesophilus TaxID=379069 RepID=UPI00191ED820|nr:M57 family metalloprotease [Galbibacter mesophilus]MCM5661556.1 zinc-dependent metalloprotease [Galbibacter mesophilus]